MASRDGREGSVRLHQDVALFAALLSPGESVTHELVPARHAWPQVVRGEIDVDGVSLLSGDGAGVSDERRPTLGSRTNSEVFLFDLA